MDAAHAAFRARRQHEPRPRPQDPPPGSRSNSPSVASQDHEYGVGPDVSGSSLNDHDIGMKSDSPSPAFSASPIDSPISSPPASEPDHPQATTTHHIIDGTPCDVNGDDCPPGTPPPPPEERAFDDYSPYRSRAEFEFADFMFSKVQMSGPNLNIHLNNLADLYPHDPPPFASHKEMYSVIDSTSVGDLPWQTFSVQYSGDLPEGDVPSWMSATYDVWFRDPLLTMEQQLGNPDFAGEMDFAPKRIFDENGKRQYTDLMSGNWAWEQAVRDSELLSL